MTLRGGMANHGGGIVSGFSCPVLENLTISGNTASAGGGINAEGEARDPLRLIDVDIVNNSGTTGGGISGFQCSMVLNNVEIIGNSSSYKGGGIYWYEVSGFCAQVSITDNTAADFGGGICMRYSVIELEETIITGNTANIGGGINGSGYGSTLSNVIISDNTAIENGGGIYLVGGSWEITNSTISGNTGTFGGGIYYDMESEPRISHSSIVDNTATAGGGGIYCYFWSHGSFENVTMVNNNAPSGSVFYCLESNQVMLNSILWNNSQEEIYLDYAEITITYSDIQGGWEGIGNIDLDPLFQDPENEDYQLQPGSPCIDAADPNSPPDPDGTIADMGAFYYNQVPNPENLEINLNAGLVQLSWEPVNGASGYVVYSSTDPYMSFAEDQGGIFNETTWSSQFDGEIRFYQVTAIIP